MKKWICAVLLAGGGLVVAAPALVHPFGRVRSANSAQPLLAGSAINPAVLRIVERSCQNCHSERTEWPWYSHAAPISWMIERDVEQAREHLNLSRWDEYTTDRQVELLSKMAAATGSREMPLPRYTLLHPAAKLSDAEIGEIDRWTRGERRRLKLPPAEGTME